MAKSTPSRRSVKAKKPYDGFPLFPHSAGVWAKKIRGKLHYFGSVKDDPNGTAALERFNREWPFLKEGRTPPPIDTGDGCTGRDLSNAFLNAKRQLLEAGEIAELTFAEYHRTCQILVEGFGGTRIIDDLTADDFGLLRAKLSKTRGPVALGNEIQRVRSVFRFGHDQGLIEKPIRYGQSFNKPSTKVMRKAKAESGSRMFEAEELRRILDALKDNPMMRAMTLLAINAGYGQNDVASLPIDALDLDAGFVTFARPKTGVPRRAKLWNETVEAVRAVLADRPKPADPEDAKLVFLTAKGKPWLRYTSGDDPAKWGNRTDLVGKEFVKVLKRLDINGRRGFYAIRHSFQTAAEGCRDFPAVMYVMGHSDSSMSGVYRERIEDDRLVNVAETVRQWLWRAAPAP